MILVDAGSLVALLDRRDPYHAAATAAAAGLPAGPLVTTWPCLTEAMYLIGRAAGWQGQSELWKWLVGGQVILRDAAASETARMADLMRTYQDSPMDLADASLVAAAESTGWRRIFTLDGHFRAYRLRDGSSLDVVP